NQTVDPAAIGTIGELYCKQVTQGIYTDECLFYQSGGGRITQLTGILTGAIGSQTSAAANGYTVLPGGIIFQWGFINATTTGAYTTLTFATNNIAFPTNCFNVSTTAYAGTPIPGSQATVIVRVSSVSNTGFQWVWATNSSNYNGFYWTAIGN